MIGLASLWINRALMEPNLDRRRALRHVDGRVDQDLEIGPASAGRQRVVIDVGREVAAEAVAGDYVIS